VIITSTLQYEIFFGAAIGIIASFNAFIEDIASIACCSETGCVGASASSSSASSSATSFKLYDEYSGLISLLF